MSKNPVVHFEMPYENLERVSKFYETAFGWEMHNTGEVMGNYIMAHAADTDENNMVKTPGTINGGFFAKNKDELTHKPSIVISVEDISVAMKMVKEAGGEVIGNPVDIPTVGSFVSFRDSEGNTASILQPIKR